MATVVGKSLNVFCPGVRICRVVTHILIFVLITVKKSVDASHVYVKPKREILKNGDILKWLKSDAYNVRR